MATNTYQEQKQTDELVYDEAKSVEKISPAGGTGTVAEIKDNEDEIAALVVASSNLRSSPKGRSNSIARKRSKYLRDIETSLSLLVPDSPEAAEEKAYSFAQAYFLKVKEELEENDPTVYQQFLETLNDFGTKINTVPELYVKISSVLSNYADLSSEFLAFLLPEQAMQCGKLMECLMITKMRDFFKRLEIYFPKQSQQMRKFYTSLSVLSTQANVTINDVRSAILPLLKGNSFLTDSFMELLPQEQPPDSLMTDFDEMGCVEVDSDNSGEDDQFETLIVPDQEDKYGCDTCICSCHDSMKQKYRSRIHHCVPCGTKFIHGRVFMQIGKILRPARVVFPDEDLAACIERLSPKQRPRKVRRKGSGHTDPGSQKDLSPSKPGQAGSCSQHPGGSQTEQSCQQSTDTTKSKAVKQRAINKYCRLRESGKSDVVSSTSVTRSSRSNSLKAPVKASGLVKEKKITNISFSQNSSLKRPRSSSRGGVRSKIGDSNAKLQRINEKENISEKKFSVEETKRKVDKLDVVNPGPPAKRPCRSVEFSDSEFCSLDNTHSTTEIKAVGTFSETSVSCKGINLQEEQIYTTKAKETYHKLETGNSSGNLSTDCIVTDLGENVETHTKCAHPESLQGNICIAADYEFKKQIHLDTDVCQPDGNYKVKNIEVVSDCFDREVKCEKEDTVPYSSSGNTSECSVPKSRVEDLSHTSWTKEEDKVILKMFQQECTTERILFMIRQQLPQRTVEQIQSRFETLMSLLQKMTGVKVEDDF